MGHKKTLSFVKLLHWVNILETFVKKKKSCIELNIFHSKAVAQMLPFFCCFFANTEENTTVLFWKSSSKQTCRCSLLLVMEVSHEKKKAAFFSRQMFSLREQKEKLLNFVCLCKIRPVTEHDEADKKTTSKKHFHGR